MQFNYNTTQKKLILPEYGRNIQNMVDYCCSIPDRVERNVCANSIICAMANLFPQLMEVNDYLHILWDHLAIMSDYKLDVDYPFEITPRELSRQRPPKLPYNNNHMRFRHYGRLLENLIDEVSKMEDGEAKETLVGITANHMKREYLNWNKDAVDNSKILYDLAELSEGKIVRYEGEVRLADASLLIDPEVQRPTTSSGKKKKKKKNKA
jgi:hypothetical protein